MKKSFIALFAFSPVLVFASTNLVEFQVVAYNSSGVASAGSCFQVNIPISQLDNQMFQFYFNSTVAWQVNLNGTFNYPPPNRFIGNTQYAFTIDYPFRVYISESNLQYRAGWGFAPSTYTFLNCLANLYNFGYRNFSYISASSSNVKLGFVPSAVLADVLGGTNTLWRSSVLSALSNINNTLSGINTSIQNINVDLGQFQTDYQNVNWDSLNFSSFVDSVESLGYIDSASANYYKNNYNSLSGDSQIGYARNISSMLNNFMKMSNDSNWALSSRNSNKVDQVSRLIGNSFGAGAAGHYTTPLTNEMKRMTTDWANETRSALSNNTQKIKDDLAAWKNQLHGTQTSIDNSVANINNTLNNIAGGSSVVRVSVADLNVGVTLSGPVTIDPSQFNSFSEDLGKAGDYMERLFNEFKWWAWDSPDSWKKGFLDRDLSRLSSNVQEQVSIQHSISNLLADFAINYTNNAQFAISNALSGFSFSSTNDYLLLSDYQTFIDSSKYDAVVSSLSPDLAAALSSFGFADSSEYSGRWWVFQSANMALQSQLALTNAALSSTLLNALSAIDDSDDSGGSLLSRWLSLINSIPDPEEIQQSLSDATNIVSNIGFERADALYSTATQDLVSVVKGIYRDKSLPDNIRFVFIPAVQGREEKYVDIPVGEHSSLWSLFRSGVAFALSVVTLILFPKYVSWLVAHYTRLVERIIKSLHAYTHQ